MVSGPCMYVGATLPLVDKSDMPCKRVKEATMISKMVHYTVQMLSPRMCVWRGRGTSRWTSRSSSTGCSGAERRWGSSTPTTRPWTTGCRCPCCGWPTCPPAPSPQWHTAIALPPPVSVVGMMLTSRGDPSIPSKYCRGPERGTQELVNGCVLGKMPGPPICLYNGRACGLF